MNIYTRSPKASSASTPRHFRDSTRWGASWAAAHPENGKAASLSIAATRRVYTGEFLAKNRAGAHARARIAADLIDGRADLGKLTAKQIVALCRASAPYVAAARKAAVAAKEPTLAETLASATPQELARELGTTRLWEALELATA